MDDWFEKIPVQLHNLVALAYMLLLRNDNDIDTAWWIVQFIDDWQVFVRAHNINEAERLCKLDASPYESVQLFIGAVQRSQIELE